MAGSPAVLRFSRGLPPVKQFGERLRLLVVKGPDKGVCFSLLGDVAVIGRDGAQILLTDGNISRKHAEVHWRGDHYEAKDLGSANGILHNGQKVAQAALRPGDTLMVGSSLMEVYPAGQVKRNERLRLAGPAGSTAASPGPVKHSAASEADIKRKREVDKKRLLIYVGLFFLVFILYFGVEEDKTIRENARLEMSESEQAGAPKKKKTKKEIDAALAEFVPTYALDTQQRKDAEIFFRSGVREQQNKNFRRAFIAFETALTVDPSHELAKIYLKSAKMEMLGELRSMRNAAVQAHKALRYKEARMHYGNIVRYLEGESGGSDLEKYIDQDMLSGGGKGKKDSIPKMYDDAKAALLELDKAENKLQ